MKHCLRTKELPKTTPQHLPSVCCTGKGSLPCSFKLNLKIGVIEIMRFNVVQMPLGFNLHHHWTLNVEPQKTESCSVYESVSTASVQQSVAQLVGTNLPSLRLVVDDLPHVHGSPVSQLTAKVTELMATVTVCRVLSPGDRLTATQVTANTHIYT